MAMYSFSLESFTAVACRSAGGLDDVWMLVTMNVGSRGAVTASPVGIGAQAGQGFTGPWAAGPYQVAVGESGVAAYTLVNLSGSTPQEQDAVVSGLGTKILAAVSGAPAGGADAAIRGVFGTAGELLGAPALPAGQPDCRGLLGVYVAPFTAASAPTTAVVATTGTVSLAAPAPAGCLATPQSTGPQSTAVFSVWQSPNLFTQSTPVTVLASGPALTEMFVVGTDGLVRYNSRGATGSFGAWQARWAQTFSQSAPLVALTGVPQRKDVFGTGTDGVIYRMSATPGTDWGDWTAVSAVGQFLPDTPVSAISINGVLSLFAVDPDGVAQSMMWNGATVVSPWAPIPGMVFARRTPLLVISHVDTYVELIAVDPLGQDVHTSHGPNLVWGSWDRPAGASLAVEPSSRKFCGLTFPVYTRPNVSADNGMAWFRVDGNGLVNEVGWNPAGWISRRTIPPLKAIPSGPVSGVRLGDQLFLYIVDAQTGRVAVASWSVPTPFNQNAPWSSWTVFPASPVLPKVREITLLSTDSTHVELFVVNREGIILHDIEDLAAGWGTWSVV